VSDEMHHDKIAVHAFLKKIITWLNENVPELRHLNIFSDGAASQFKQKYNLCNLTFFNETFGIDVAWHFFASGHGKGACDGIGATIKRSVWLRVKTGKFQVTNAEEFYNCALRIDSTVNVFFLSSENIRQDYTSLCVRWDGIKTIPGTQTFHCFAPVSPNVVMARHFSADSRQTKVHIHDFHYVQGRDLADQDSQLLLQSEPHVGFVYKVLLPMTQGKKEKKIPYFVMVRKLRPATQTVEVSYLKNCSGSTKMFTIPEEDVAEIDYFKCDELISVQQPVLKRRGVFSFQ
jgi:hypothetical protein